MRLSTKGRYGLRALLDVAVYSEEEPVSIRSIAQRQNISEAYLEQLMPKLKKAGLIDSQRGASGGYRLTGTACPGRGARCCQLPGTERSGLRGGRLLRGAHLCDKVCVAED